MTFHYTNPQGITQELEPLRFADTPGFIVFTTLPSQQPPQTLIIHASQIETRHSKEEIQAHQKACLERRLEEASANGSIVS